MMAERAVDVSQTPILRRVVRYVPEKDQVTIWQFRDHRSLFGSACICISPCVGIGELAQQVSLKVSIRRLKEANPRGITGEVVYLVWEDQLLMVDVMGPQILE